MHHRHETSSVVESSQAPENDMPAQNQNSIPVTINIPVPVSVKTASKSSEQPATTPAPQPAPPVAGQPAPSPSQNPPVVQPPPMVPQMSALILPWTPGDDDSLDMSMMDQPPGGLTPGGTRSGVPTRTREDAINNQNNILRAKKKQLARKLSRRRIVIEE